MYFTHQNVWVPAHEVHVPHAKISSIAVLQVMRAQQSILSDAESPVVFKAYVLICFRLGMSAPQWGSGRRENFMLERETRYIQFGRVET